VRMAEARPRHYNRKATGNPVGSGVSAWNSTEQFPPAPQPEQVRRLLNRKQAQEEFGLTQYAIYAAVQRDELEPLQVGGRGRIYYSERQLRALKERITTQYHLMAA
jgi:hypothetical protein